MDFMEFITGMYVPIIVVACLVVGYIAKKWIKDVENKYIPTIVFVLGIVLGLFMNGLTVEAGVAGAVSGLASTGLHQMFTRLIENKTDESEVDK